MEHILTQLHSSPKDILIDIESREYCHLSSIERLDDRNFLERLKGQTRTDRINIYCSSIRDSVGRFAEPFDDTYCWYVCVRPVSSLQTQPSGHLSADMAVERLSCSEIRAKDREEIIDYWESQYVEVLQGNRSIDQKADLSSSILTTLGEGTHYLYRRQNRLVGHGAFVDDVNEVLHLPNLYVHLWTHQEEKKDTRSMVLAHYFSELLARKKVLTAGIAVNNQKSLRVFSLNGFDPVILSMGVYR